MTKHLILTEELAQQVIAAFEGALISIDSSSNPYAGIDEQEVIIARRKAVESALRIVAEGMVEQEPVATAISYWEGPSDIDGNPRQYGHANTGKWTIPEPSTLKHGQAIIERGDTDKKVNFLFAHPQPPVSQQYQWQPIETAPVDGTEVLAARPKRHGRGVILQGMAKQGADNWWLTSDGDRPQQPTHWMPLPKPPTT